MLNCYVTTLKETLYEGDAQEVQVPGSEGYFGVLPGHEKFISGISFGELSIIDSKGKKQKFLVKQGVFQVVMDRVIIVLDFGSKVDDLNVSKAEYFINYDEKRIKELQKSSYDDPDLVEHLKSRIAWNKEMLEYITRA